MMETYIQEVFICIIDKPISYDPQTLIPPDPHKVVHFLKPVRGGEAQAMIDTRQISQVKDVVELGGGWGQLLDNCAVMRETNCI